MKMERQAAMAKSVAKNMKAKERSNRTKEQAYSDLYKVLHKAGKSLDEVNAADLSKKEYQVIVTYFEVVRGMSEFQMARFYPNLNL